MLAKEQDVAIFWDIENCAPPKGCSGYELVKAIRSISQRYGTIQLFKAYRGAVRSMNVALRSALQSSGVSLIDCPQNGRKDTADKMILVDMLTHSVDRPAPTTFVLISGDRDCAYALSILRLRRYNVVLIAQPHSHISLTSHASVCFNWKRDITQTISTSASRRLLRPAGIRASPYSRARSPPLCSQCSTSLPELQDSCSIPNNAAPSANYDEREEGECSPSEGDEAEDLSEEKQQCASEEELHGYAEDDADNSDSQSVDDDVDMNEECSVGGENSEEECTDCEEEHMDAEDDDNEEPQQFTTSAKAGKRNVPPTLTILPAHFDEDLSSESESSDDSSWHHISEPNPIVPDPYKPLVARLQYYLELGTSEVSRATLICDLGTRSSLVKFARYLSMAERKGIVYRFSNSVDEKDDTFMLAATWRDGITESC